MNLQVTNEMSAEMVGEVSEYLLMPRLWIPEADYPDHYDWVQRSATELQQGRKKSMLALGRACIFGVIIYQRDKANPKLLEIKNLSIAPHFTARRLASFMLRNVEVDGAQQFPGVERVSVDTKTDNSDVIEFFLSQGYAITAIQDLYRLGAGEDVVLEKALSN